MDATARSQYGAGREAFMVEIVAKRTIVLGEPFDVAFRSEHRVSGRLRLTAGTEALSFVLERADREPVSGSGPRIRGKSGSFRIRDWGEHEPGAELVLRFEGAKLWLTVVALDDDDEPEVQTPLADE
jgi:hypothetical protein